MAIAAGGRGGAVGSSQDAEASSGKGRLGGLR